MSNICFVFFLTHGNETIELILLKAKRTFVNHVDSSKVVCGLEQQNNKTHYEYGFKIKQFQGWEILGRYFNSHLKYICFHQVQC